MPNPPVVVPQKRQSFTEAVSKARAEERGEPTLTPEEENALDDPSVPYTPAAGAQSPPPGYSSERSEEDDDSSAEVDDPSKLPSWVKIPDAPWTLPTGKGKKIIALRFFADTTDFPEKGDRQVIMWSLTLADERTALRRVQGRRELLQQEFTMQMIRAIDGMPVDWTRRNRAADPTVFFDEIGPKCREMMERIYNSHHNMNQEEQVAFFGRGIALLSRG